MSNQESVAPPCVDVTLIYSLWFRSRSPPARRPRPPLANTLSAHLHIRGRKLLAGVESNFQSVPLSLSQSGAAGGRSQRKMGSFGRRSYLRTQWPLSPEGVNAAERARRRKESDSEFPNSFLIVLSRGASEAKQSDLFGARNALRLSTAECKRSA